jgi:hypothetical protein
MMVMSIVLVQLMNQLGVEDKLKDNHIRGKSPLFIA